MAKIVLFTKSSAASSHLARGHVLDAFVDDGDLLEFPQPEGPQTHGTTEAQVQTRISIIASDWSNQELADLYRAYSLVQSAQPGLECDRGVSDEGDPWFLIGDDKGDVLIHICRIKRTYTLDSVGLAKPLRGTDFNALIQDFLTNIVGEEARYPHDKEAANEPTNVIRLARGGTVCLHPSMMIAALVWTLLMNADELNLPPSNGTTHRGLDQNQDGTQGKDQDDDLSSRPDYAVTAEDIADKAHLAKSERSETGAADFSADPRTNVMLAQIAQRDEKPLHVSAYSNALTTIAISVGFYASAKAFDIFWNSTLVAPDTPATSGETEASELSQWSAPVNHLSEALALLSSVVDLVVFESNEDYALENQTENTDALEPVGLQTMDASIGRQLLTMASEVFNNLAESSQIKILGAPNKNIGDEIDFEAVRTLAGDNPVGLHGTGSELNAQNQVLRASIEGVTGAYAFRDVDVYRFDAASFKAGIDRFYGKLEKYSDIFEDSGLTANDEISLSFETEATFTNASRLNAFDAAARSFIDSKIATADLEILVFDNEIIFVDKAAFSNDNSSISWQLEDGGIVSMIGLSSEMAEFFFA